MNYIDRICSLSVVLLMNCVVFAAVSDADEPDIAELKRPVAIQDTRLRRFPFPSDTDWEEVEKNHKRIGDKLRDFLNLDIKDRVVLPLQ